MISTIGGFFDLNHFDQSSRANDVIVIRHRDGSLHSTPFNVRFGRARIWNSVNKVVQVEVNGVMTKAVMKIGKGGEAFWLHPTYQRPSHPHEQRKYHQEHNINAHVQEYLDNRENVLVNNNDNNNNNNNDNSGQIKDSNVTTKHNDVLQHSNTEFLEQENKKEQELQEQLESTLTEKSNNTECAKSPSRTSEKEECKEVHNCDGKITEETRGQLTTEIVANHTSAQECGDDKSNNNGRNRNNLYANEHGTQTTASPIASKNDVLLAEQVLKAAAEAEKRLSKLNVVNELLEWGVEHEDTVNSSGNNNYENVNNIVNTNHDEEVKVNEKEHEGLSGKNERSEIALCEALGQENSIVKDDNGAGVTQSPAQLIKLNKNEKNYNNYESHLSAEKENDGARYIDDNHDESVSNDYDKYKDDNGNNNNDDDEDDDDDDDDDLYLLDPIDISDYTSSELRNRELLEPVIVDGSEIDKQRSREITKNAEERHDMESNKKEENNANNLLKQIKQNQQLLESQQEHLLLTEKANEQSLNEEQDEDERKWLQRQQMEEEYEAYAETDQLPNWSFSSSVTSGLSVKDDSMLEPETSYTSEDEILHDPSSALRTHDQHYNQYASYNNATNNNNSKIRNHVELNVKSHEPAYAENTTSEEHSTPYFTRSLLPTVTDLIKLNLKYGANEVKYVTRKSYDTPLITVSCNIYLWNYNDKIIVSDIDGTITKSDLWGHFYSMLGKGGEWTHPGICALYTKIVNNGYKILYLSARSVTQIYQTKNYLWSLEQEKAKLPLGPVLTAPLRIFTAITKEVSKQSHVFKIACLTSVLDAYPQHSKPFFAGFGNRYGDVVSYSAVHIPIYRIFIIDPSSVLHICRVKQTYRNLTHLVDMTFPPLKSLTVLPTAPSWQLMPVTHKGGSNKELHTEANMPSNKNVEQLANAKGTLHHTLYQQEEKLSQLSDVQSNSTTSYNVDENSDDGKSNTDFADNYDEETGSVISVEHNDKNAREGKGATHQHASNHSMAFDLTNNNTLIDNVNGEQCTICTMYDKNSQCREKFIKSNKDNIVNVTDIITVTDAKADNESKDNMHKTDGDHGNFGDGEYRKYDLGSRHDQHNSAIRLESVNKTSVPRVFAPGNQDTHKESRSPWHDQAINVNVNHINNSNNTINKSKHDFPLLVDDNHYNNVNDDIHVDPEFASFQFWSVNPADLIEPVRVKTKVETITASSAERGTAATTNKKGDMKSALQVQKQSSIDESKLKTTQAPSMELLSTVKLTDNTIVASSSVNSNMPAEEKMADTLLRKMLIASPRQYTRSKFINDNVGENTSSNNNYDDKSKTKSTKEQTIANNGSDAQKSSNASKQENSKIKSHVNAEKKSSRFFSFVRVWSQNSSSSSKAITHDNKTEESITTSELQQKRYQHPDLATYLPADAIALHKSKNVSYDVNNNVNIEDKNTDVKENDSNNEGELKDSTKDANLTQTPILKSEGESVEEITPRKLNNDNVSLSPTTSMLSSLAFWKKNVAVPDNVSNNNKKETIDELANMNDKKDINVNSDSSINNNHSKEKEFIEKDIIVAEKK